MCWILGQFVECCDCLFDEFFCKFVIVGCSVCLLYGSDDFLRIFLFFCCSFECCVEGRFVFECNDERECYFVFVQIGEECFVGFCWVIGDVDEVVDDLEGDVEFVFVFLEC